jgi:hypothetical protein
MRKVILLRGSYNVAHKLILFRDFEYVLHTRNSLRVIKNGNSVIALDLSGGPMIKVGSILQSTPYKVENIRFSEDNPKGYIVTLKPSLRQRVYESKFKQVQL